MVWMDGSVSTDPPTHPATVSCFYRFKMYTASSRVPPCKASVKGIRTSGVFTSSRLVGTIRTAKGRRYRQLLHRAQAAPTLEAVVFDCDGVILESENLHREAYNAAFEEFGVSCDGGESILNWDEEYYDDLQNKVGGGKPKMRWYFGKNGWPVTMKTDVPPSEDEDRESLIDELQDWKTQKYQALIGSGDVSPRPGVLRFMEEAKSKGLKVAVCSAATKSSVVFTLTSLLGEDQFNSLDCFLAGDDVTEKKPSPLIYQIASEKLGVQPEQCLVVEDSVIGLSAAVGAGMRCLITYTGSTKAQDFAGAERIVHTLDGPPEVKLEEFC